MITGIASSCPLHIDCAYCRGAVFNLSYTLDCCDVAETVIKLIKFKLTMSMVKSECFNVLSNFSPVGAVCERYT